jgi:hypothetical protein
VEEHRRDHLWTHVEPGTGEALDLLLGAGYRLAVISNADGRMESVLSPTGLRPYLEFVVDSGRWGSRSPIPAIFREGLRRLGLPPRGLYVGDLYPVDVVGPGGGLEALLLDPSGTSGHPVPRIPSVLTSRGGYRRGEPGTPAPATPEARVTFGGFIFSGACLPSDPGMARAGGATFMERSRR